MSNNTQAQLDTAVREEDFTQAANLTRTIREMRETDVVSSIERRFKNAVATEDYAAAAKFRDAGAGLTGWWAGRGATEEEPGGAYGVMMQVTAQHGRYVGTSYSARDLAVLQESTRQRQKSGPLSVGPTVYRAHSLLVPQSIGPTVYWAHSLLGPQSIDYSHHHNYATRLHSSFVIVHRQLKPPLFPR